MVAYYGNSSKEIVTRNVNNYSKTYKNYFDTVFWHRSNQILWSFVAISCPIPPAVSNSSTVTSSLSFGGITSYTCEPGLRFKDGYTTKEVTCSFDKTWQPAISSDCRGNIKLFVTTHDLS